jgi:hypothetical protein
VFWVLRDLRAFRRTERREQPADGQLLAASGAIRPLGSPLIAPFSGEPCVAYEYEIVSEQRVPRGKQTATKTDAAGFALAAASIETPHGGIRLLGFPILDQFPQSRGGFDARPRAERYLAATSFEATEGLAALRMFSAFDDALADEDGVVKKDFRMTDGEIPVAGRLLQERLVKVGQQVCALGRYDAQKRALVPRGATLNRLWPGTLAQVRRTVWTTARSQTILGLTFFVVTHAMLGLAFYMSETRHAREPESEQAAVIRRAVQENDLDALEQAVRRGANPNARDSFGDPVIFEVRDPAMIAALARLGADVNVRHRDDQDTPLIRAVRAADVGLVNALLAAHANVDAVNRAGESALAAAAAGGHIEIEALLRSAARGLDVEKR